MEKQYNDSIILKRNDDYYLNITEALNNIDNNEIDNVKAKIAKKTLIYNWLRDREYVIKNFKAIIHIQSYLYFNVSNKNKCKEDFNKRYLNSIMDLSIEINNSIYEYFEVLRDIKVTNRKKETLLKGDVYVPLLHDKNYKELLHSNLVYIDFTRPIEDIFEYIKRLKKYFDNQNVPKVFIEDKEKNIGLTTEQKLEIFEILNFNSNVDNRNIVNDKYTDLIYIFDSLVIGISKKNIKKNIVDYYLHTPIYENLNIGVDAIYKHIQNAIKKVEKIFNIFELQNWKF